MLRSKKALSPLIAGVLLIVVVVGIGAVVTGIVRGLITENQETIASKDNELACSTQVDVELVKIDGVPQICKGAAYVDLIVENNGVEVQDFQLTILGSGGIFKNESVSTDNPLGTGQAREYNISFSGTGSIEQIKFVPKLKARGSGYNFCHEVAITYEDIPDC